MLAGWGPATCGSRRPSPRPGRRRSASAPRSAPSSASRRAARWSGRRGPAGARAELGVGGGRRLVGAIGGLHPQKGYDVLLDAVVGWRERIAPLVAIAGDGPLHEQLAARIAAQRLPVRLLGRR